MTPKKNGGEEQLKAPFPWFGGKSKVAKLVWERFGEVGNYVEPFFGSGAVLLGRPAPWTGVETVNDRDGFICNFWRAIQAAPDEVARWCDWPQNENDLHARHYWLKERRADLTRRLEGDPEYYDAKIAGWWCWGLCLWIGSGWCNEQVNVGPWSVVEGEDGTRQLLHLGSQGKGINRQLLHLGDQGQGINRQLLHLGSQGQGINRQLLHLGSQGKGINRKLLHLGDQGKGINRQRLHLGDQGKESPLSEWFAVLASRFRRVRVCSGDWSRVCGPSVTFKHGLTGVFLDPPYSAEADRHEDGLYATDDLSCAHAVREWALEWGKHPLMRIALCGYEGEHTMPDTWECVPWKASGGYGSQATNGSQAKGRANRHRERIWFSPHCLKEQALNLFAEIGQPPTQGEAHAQEISETEP